MLLAKHQLVATRVSRQPIPPPVGIVDLAGHIILVRPQARALVSAASAAMHDAVDLRPIEVEHGKHPPTVEIIPTAADQHFHGMPPQNASGSRATPSASRASTIFTGSRPALRPISSQAFSSACFSSHASAFTSTCP